jgi:hypothetical protein
VDRVILIKVTQKTQALMIQQTTVLVGLHTPDRVALVMMALVDRAILVKMVQSLEFVPVFVRKSNSDGSPA